MAHRENNKKFAFVHINKTGGTSILHALGLPKEHLTAVEMRERYKDSWEEMLTFSFVRNPWDKVVSHYHYRVETNQTNLGSYRLPFKEWVLTTYGHQDHFYYDNERMFMPQIKWVSDADGEIIVDFIGRFETIDEDFSKICAKLSLPKHPLLHLNKSKHRPYAQYYDNESRAVIGNWFKDDIAQFGYKF